MGKIAPQPLQVLIGHKDRLYGVTNLGILVEVDPDERTCREVMTGKEVVLMSQEQVKRLIAEREEQERALARRVQMDEAFGQQHTPQIIQ